MCLASGGVQALPPPGCEGNGLPSGASLAPQRPAPSSHPAPHLPHPRFSLRPGEAAGNARSDPCSVPLPHVRSQQDQNRVQIQFLHCLDRDLPECPSQGAEDELMAAIHTGP